jgi:hypothetical protein
VGPAGCCTDLAFAVTAPLVTSAATIRPLGPDP